MRPRVIKRRPGLAHLMVGNLMLAEVRRDDENGEYITTDRIGDVFIYPSTERLDEALRLVGWRLEDVLAITDQEVS